MSDTNRLNIQITAEDQAQAKIKELNATVKTLEAALAQFGNAATAAGQKNIASFTAQITATKAQIAAIKEMAAALRTQEQAAQAALRSVDYLNAKWENANRNAIAAHQRSEASYINQNMDRAATTVRRSAEYENRDRTLAAGAQRAEAEYANRDIDLRAAQARLEAVYENQARDAAYDKARLEALEQNRAIDAAYSKARAEALYTQRDMELAAAKTRAEAEYANRDMDLAATKTRAEAVYQNRDLDLAAAKARSEAVYANRDMDMATAKIRAEAAYANRDADLATAKIRAEAAYENRDKDLAAIKARQEADFGNANWNQVYNTQRSAAFYENRDKDLAYAAQRRAAEYENAEYDRRLRAQRAQEAGASRTGAGIIAAAGSPASAAAAAAARTSLSGGTQSQIEAAAAEAAERALRRQAEAARAVEAAERIAAAAGASQGEITAAGARAATMALEAQARAADRFKVSGPEKEIRHVVAAFDEISRGQKGALFGTLGAAARDAGLGVGALASTIGLLGVAMAGAGIIHFAENMGKWAVQSRAAASAVGMSIEDYTQLAASMQRIGLRADEADASMRKVAESLSTALSQPASKAAEAFHNLGIKQEELVATGGDTAKVLRLLADAFVHTEDSGNKTANMAEIAGRDFEKLISLLQNGSVGMDEMKAKMKALGLSLDEDGARKLEEIDQKLSEFEGSVKGKGIKALLEWQPVILGIIDILDKLAGAISDIAHAVASIPSLVASGANAIAANMPGGTLPSHKLAPGLPSMLPPGMDPETHAPGPVQAEMAAGVKTGDKAFGPAAPPKAAVPPLEPATTPIMQMEADVAKAEAAAGQAALKAGKTSIQAHMAETEAAIAGMQKVLQTAQLTGEQRTQIEKDVANKQKELANETISANTAAAHAGAAAARQAYADFAAAERLKVASADGNMSQILAIYDEWLAAAEGRYKQHANVIEEIERQKTQAINTARLQQIKEGASLEEKLNTASVTMNKADMLAAGDKTYQGQRTIGGVAPTDNTVSASLGELSKIDAAMQKEVGALAQVMATAEAGSATQKSAAQEILNVITQAKQQEVSLYQTAAEAVNKAAAKMLEPFTKLFDSIGSQFDQLGKSLLNSIIAPQIDLVKQGLTTIKINERNTQIHQALAKFATDLVDDATQSLQSTASKLIAGQLSKLLSIPIESGGGIASLLSGGLSKLTGMGAQTASNAVFATAADTLQTGATTLYTAALTLQGGSAASGSSGAAGILGMFGLSLFARGGIVPSAAGGMVVGGTGGSLALLHPKEMVLPANISQGLQGMINGGRSGGNNANLNYSPTVNVNSRSRGGTGMTRAEFGQMMANHGGSLLGEARNLMRTGWRP